MVAVQTLSFGAQLKRARREAGLTQEALAARSGYSVTYISKLETGTRQPLVTTAELLADALSLGEAARTALHAAALADVAPPATALVTLPAMLPAEAPVTPTGSPAPLVGRAAELAQLDALLLGQAPPVLVLAGEPGIGKTRLLREAARRAPGAGWTVLEGTCQRRGGQEPFAPFVSLLAERIAQRTLAQRRAELEGCAWLARLLPELGELIAPPKEPVAPGGGALAPAQERRLVFQAVRRFLEQSAGPAGTLLLLDDLQWAGMDALDLLAALVTAPPARPLRVVAAYRDTDLRADDPLALLLGDLVRAGLAARRPVGPLAHEDAVALLDALLGSVTGGSTGARPALAERLVRRAGGVPFFLVCYAQGLGAGALDGSLSASVPWDVAQAIRQRMLALPPAAQEALSVGAVIGRQVPGRLLASVATQPEQPGLDERAILAGIDAACQARLLLAVGEEGYEFAHELIRDVVRGDLGAARRAALHRRVAGAIEREPGEVPASVLAYHFGQAGDLARAAHYLERAGDRAMAMRAHAGALGYYQEWVERLDRLDQPLEAARAREKLGMLYKDLARYTQALEVLERAAESYLAAGDREGLLRATTQIGAAHARRGTPREGLARLEPLLTAGGVSGGTAGTSTQARATAWVALAQLYRVSGRYDEDLAAAERAVKLARTARDTRLQAWAQEHRGWALLMLSRTREAVPVLEQAVRLAEAAGDLNSLAYALNEVAILHELRGETETYRACVERALKVAEQLGDPAALALMLYNRADAAFLLGEWTEAQADLERALVALDQSEATLHSPWPLFGLGRLALVCGQQEDAVRLIEQAIALADRGNNVELLRYAHGLLAERELLAGDSKQAITRLATVLDQADHDEVQVTPFLPLYAWALFEQGREREAREVLERAIARAEAAELRPALVNALRMRVLLALHQRDWSGAEADLKRAQAVVHGLHDPYAEAKVLYTAGLLADARGHQEQRQHAMTAAQALLDRLGERLYAAHVQGVLLPVQRR